MRRNNFYAFAMAMMFLFSVSGCSQKPQAASSSDAIEQSKSIQTPEEQANYLLTQAKSFADSKKYDEAIATAQYVAGQFSQKAEEAKKIIEQATADMAKMAEQKMSEAKDQANKAVDNLQGKLNSLGK